MRSTRNFAARGAKARNDVNIAKFPRRVKHAKSRRRRSATEVARSKTKSAIQKKPRASSCQASVQRMAAAAKHAAKAKRAAREAEAAATSAAAADDEVEFAGERTREQRDAELRAWPTP